MSLTKTFVDTFTPGPSGPITAWLWDFGDGTTSTDQNPPPHTFPAAGTYDVTLTVTGSGSDGTASITKAETVTDPSPTPPTAAFSFSASGLTVTFTESSTPGPSGPITAWAWNFGDGTTSSVQNPPPHTYPADGSYTVSLTVTGTSSDGTDNVTHAFTVTAGGGGGTKAAFPSILSCSGQNIVDANGFVIPRMKGFNIQPGGNWPQSAYNDIYALGGRVLRAMVFWDLLEPSAGNISSSFISQLDTLIARAEAAGLYVILCFYYGPNGVHCPTWVGSGSSGSRLVNYQTHGQHATEYLAKRYGDVSDPLGAGKYTPAVIGFGINEPTPDSSSNGYLATHMSEQHTMMTWFRAYAPDWIGIISCGYGGGAPIHNATGSGHTSGFHNQTFTDADDDPFSGMGNWLMDLHVYKEATNISATTPSYDGRNAYGMPDGSQQIDVGSNPYPPSGVTRAECQAFLTAFLASHVEYCGAGRANVPLMIGEWGWKPSLAGGVNFADDLAAALIDAGVVIADQWDYNTSTGSDPWAARAGGTWDPATSAFAGAF